MTVTYIKRATRPLNETSPDVRARVAELLAGLKAGREAEAKRLATEFDGWNGPIVVTSDEIAARISRLEGMEGHARTADLRRRSES